MTIGVLPFDNLNGDPETDYLASGLTEDTIVSLGRIDPERVSVIGRTSMIAYADTSKSLAEIGRELGTDYLVESSLRAESGHLRITAQADSRERPGPSLVRLLRQQRQQHPRLAAGDQLCHRRAGPDASVARAAARAGTAAHAECRGLRLVSARAPLLQSAHARGDAARHRILRPGDRCRSHVRSRVGEPCPGTRLEPDQQ